MANKPDVCSAFLEGTITKPKFDRAELEAIRNAREKDPAKAKQLEDLLQANLKAQIEDGLDVKVRQVSDVIKAQTLYNTYTKNPFTGETFTAAADVIQHRLKSLVGRNSIDTKLRGLRNHLRNQIDEYGIMFRTHENAQFKTLRDIKGGSDEERILFKKVHAFEEQLDVDNMTPEKVNALLAKHTDQLDRLALSMVAYNEYARKTMGKYGVSVKFNKNFVMKRRYDWAALERMGADGFAEFMVKQLNIKETFGEGATEETALRALRNEIYNDFRLRANDRMSSLDTGDFAASPNSKGRTFVYKDSEAEYQAFHHLSVGGMREQFEKNAMAMASTAIKVSEFGYDSKKVLQELNAKLLENFQPSTGKQKTLDQWRESRIIQAEQELAGQTNLVQGSITNFSNNVRFMTALTKLGTTLATTAADALENNRQVFYTNGEAFGGITSWLGNMVKMTAGYSKEEKIQLANSLGLIFSHQSNAEGMRLASGDISVNGGMLTRLIQEHGGKALNIATLLPSQTGVSKLSSGLVGAEAFSKLVSDVSAGKGNAFQLDTMKEYGFTEKEIKLLGSSHVEKTANWSSTAIHTGGNIRRLLQHKGGPDFIAKELGIDPDKAGQAVLDLAGKYEGFINDFVTRGTPTPELSTKTLMFKGVQNEHIRAAINLFSQFMDTPMAQAEHFMELARKLHRVHTVDGDMDMMGLTKSVVSHSAVYLPVGVGMYLAADAAMSIATNSESMVQQLTNGDEQTRSRVWFKAVSRTGFVPYLAEVIDNQWGGGYNKTVLDTFGGPNISTARDIARLLQTKEGGGIEVGEFLKRHGGTNSIPLRALNNWTGFARSEKIWDDKKGTFLGN